MNEETAGRKNIHIRQNISEQAIYEYGQFEPLSSLQKQQKRGI
jgi:hypothetical protein